LTDSHANAPKKSPLRAYLAMLVRVSRWHLIGVIIVTVLFSLSGLYARVPKDTPARSEVLLAAVVMITNWSINLFLMGKIGGH